MGGHDFKTGIAVLGGHRQDRFLIIVNHTDKNRPFSRQVLTGSELCFGISGPKIRTDSHDLSGRFHCRVRPSITLVASLANGTPVALLTNGMVRDALGLTSST